MERRMDRRDRERLAARQHHQDHRVDLDSRTPLAWQHRDFNYQVPHTSSFNERYPEGAVPPSSSSDRFSHPAASVGSRSARSARQPAQSKSSNSASSRPPASKKTSTSSSGTNNGGLAAGNSNITVTPRTASAGSSSGGNRNSSVPGRHHHHLRGHHHPSRSSEETTTGGSASETETDAERGHQPSLGRPGTSGTLRSMQSMPLLSPLLHHQAAFNPMLGPAAGSIYGVLQPPPPHPSMMTWNGEPCPVHGAGLHHHGMATLSGYPQPSAIYSSMASMRRAASIHELAALASTPMHPALMPPPPPPSAIYGTLPHPQIMMQADPMQHHFMMMAGPPPQHHHPPGSLMGGTRMIRPMMRSGPSSLPPMGRVNNGGRPMVVNGKNGQPEPLPVREAPPLPPKIPASDVMSMRAVSTKAGSGASGSSVKPFSYRACCQGNVVVLWVIMGIIGLGVVMAIVFYYAFK